ncbi:hypothetical protein F4X73_10305 [Candidatus Poribacteria bacterium]|nr:hypothetical protein [Candidatus Poribacteria bacterium]
MRKKHLNKNSLWHNSIKSTARTVAILSGLVSSVFVILMNIMGCSDSPYRSNMLTPEDVDRYLFAPDSDTLCLTNGYDTKCVTLVPNGRESRLPVIHIYPKKVVYVFYYEGNAVIRAERHRDDIIDPPIVDIIDPPIDDIIDPPIVDIIDPPIDDDKEQGSGGSGVGPRDDVNGGTPGSGNNGNNQGNNGNNNNQGSNNNNNGNNQGNNNNGNTGGTNNGNNQ